MRNTIIRASAGTGKTYQLSSRFVALLAEGVAPNRLIALTFTKKAAAEFAQRILLRLADGALSEREAKTLANELSGTMAELGNRVNPADLSVDRLRRLLEEMVENLHRLSLTTLDSFFVRIVRNFPYELGISEFRLIDESEQTHLRMKSMQSTFRSLSEENRLFLFTLFREINAGKTNVGVRETMLELFTAFHEIYLENPDPNLWGNWDSLKLCRVGDEDDGEDARGLTQEEFDHFSFEKEVDRLLEDLDGRLDECVDAAKAASASHTKFKDAFKKLLKEIRTYQPGRTKINLETMGKRLLENLESLRNGSDEHYAIPREIQFGLYRVLRAYAMAEVKARASQTQSLYALMSLFESNYRKEIRALGMLTFGDVTRLLREGGIKTTRGEGKLQIESRLDANYDHWMLDEFQDTSRTQFGVLENLLDEAVLDPGENRSLFVVGDVKQALYGWRGGDVRLFGEMAGRPGWSDRLETKEMQLSYRSSQPVLDLCNAVFSNDAPFIQELNPALVEKFGYRTHTAHQQQMRGYATVVMAKAYEEVVDKKGKISQKRLTSDDAREAEYELIESILRRVKPLERGLTCAILVRKNHVAKVIAEEMRARIPGLCVEIESNTMIVTDQPLGVAIMDLFRWFTYPGNDFAREHVHHTPIRIALETWGETPRMQWEKGREILRERGVSGVLADCLAAWQKQPGLLSDFLKYRADALMRLAISFDESGETDGEKWLICLENALQRDRATPQAIQVMTIHKAKGMEFDCVIVASLGDDLYDDSSKCDLMELKSEGGSKLECLLRPPSRKFLECLPEMNERFARWADDAIFESMANVYVALTRAKYASYVVAMPPSGEYAKKAEGSKLSYIRWLYDLWGRDQEFFDDECADLAGYLLYEDGDPSWFEVQSAKNSPEAGAVRNPKLLPPEARVARATPSREKSKKSRVTGNEDAMRFGTQVHEAFEAIGWLDVEKPVLPATRAGELVRDLIADSSLAEIFRKRGRNVELFREQPLEVMLDQRWMSGVLDRLHLIRDAKGAVIHCELIDFKTDQVDSESVLQERYAGQMHAYDRALQHIYPEATREIFLLSTALKKMVAVSGSR